MLEGWKQVCVGDVAKVLRGASPRPKGDPRYYGGNVPRLMVADVTRDGRFVTPQIDFLTDAGAKLSRPMPAGTLTMVCSGDVGTPSFLAVDACIHDGFLAVDDISDICLPEYLYEVFGSLKARLERSATHGGVFTNLTTDILREFPFQLPPLPEQRLIAEILGTWDEAIEKLEALRAGKERRLHILREKLTYADVRHEPTRLGDVTEEVTTRNGAGILDRNKVMGVSNSRGIVPMREQTIAGDISRYKIVADQAFAYNPMRINVGSIARNQTGEDILVSPDYVAFECSLDGMLPDYLDHLRKTKWWAHYINSGGSGSVRQRTYYSDLAAMKVPLPKVAEQRSIADVLNTAQRDADATSREITALQRQKRGLMQKLLTGEWRVKVDESTEALT